MSRLCQSDTVESGQSAAWGRGPGAQYMWTTTWIRMFVCMVYWSQMQSLQSSLVPQVPAMLHMSSRLRFKRHVATQV